MIESRRVPIAESGGAATAEITPPRRFLELLAARDFERLAASLASDAHARFLLPHGLEEYDGRDAIVARVSQSSSLFTSISGLRASSVSISSVLDSKRSPVSPPARRRSSTPAIWAAPTAWLRSSGARWPTSR